MDQIVEFFKIEKGYLDSNRLIYFSRKIYGKNFKQKENFDKSEFIDEDYEKSP